MSRRRSNSRGPSCHPLCRRRSTANCSPPGGPGRTASLREVASRWGLSPFSLVLPALSRARRFGGRPVALSARGRRPKAPYGGAVEGLASSSSWHRSNRGSARSQPSVRATYRLRRHSTTPLPAASYWKVTRRRQGLPNRPPLPRRPRQEAKRRASTSPRVSQDLDALIARQAARHTGWFTHAFYESLLLAMVGFLLFRLGKNFFYDSWWSGNHTATWGLEMYVASAFWLVLWCFLLLWLFTRQLRSGLARSHRLPACRELELARPPHRAFSPTSKKTAAAPASSAGSWSCWKERLKALRGKL